MWLSPETRFTRHVCLRNPFLSFLFGIPSIQSLPEEGSWELQYVPAALLYACTMRISSLQPQERTSLMQRSRGFGRGVVFSKICYTYSDYALSCAIWLLQTNEPLNNFPDWAFSHSGLEVGLPAFQLLVFEKCDSLPKRDLCDMLYTYSCDSFLEFQASNLCQKKVPESRSMFKQLCFMLAPCASLRCSRRNESVSCREAEGLVAELFSPRFVIHTVIMLSVVQSDCCKPMNHWTIFQIELWATVGWKWGCQPFSCSCLKNVTHSRKEIYATCLLKESIPAITFGNSKHFPTRSFRFLRPTLA